MMDLVENPDTTPTIADAYDKMGDLIRRNADQQFGGAFVITPPGDVPAMSSLFINEASPGMFWGALKTLCDQALIEIDKVERNMRSGFAR
jgi:hypothetical protein